MRLLIAALAAGCTSQVTTKEVAAFHPAWESICEGSFIPYSRFDGSESRRSAQTTYTVCKVQTVDGTATSTDVILSSRNGIGEHIETCALSLGPIRIAKAIAPDLLTRVFTDRALAGRVSAAMKAIDPHTRYDFEMTLEGIHVSAMQWVSPGQGAYVELEVNACERHADTDPPYFKVDGPLAFIEDAPAQPTK